MKSLAVLLAVTIVSLCDADYDKNGFLISSSEEFTGSNEKGESSCGKIMSSTGPQFRSGAQFQRAKRTVGGTDAKYNEFPWMVVVFVPRTKGRQCELIDDFRYESSCWFLRCGGSLISLKAVLTSGLCVYDYRQDKLKVRAGDWNLDTFDEWLPYQERFVADIIIHPFFQNGYGAQAWFKYDAALLVVESPYVLSDNIGFICLPPPDLQVASVNCKVAGWGKWTTNGSGYQPVLQVVEHNFTDHDQCKMIIWDLVSRRFVLYDSFVCAYDVDNKQSCHGDGGGPLMCLGDDHYYARGIFSWGFGCSLAGRGGTFTDTVKMRNWIDQHMRGYGFNTDTYTHFPDRK